MKSIVTLGATEPSDALKISLRESAGGALQHFQIGSILFVVTGCPGIEKGEAGTVENSGPFSALPAEGFLGDVVLGDKGNEDICRRATGFTLLCLGHAGAGECGDGLGE